MVSHWSLSESKSPRVSRALLSILTVLNNAVISMVSTRLLTSKSFRPFNGLSYCAKSTNHNWYNCHLHVSHFFQFSSKVELFILLFTFFQFYSVVSWESKVDNFANYLFFLLIIIRSGLLAEIRWSVCMSHRSSCVSFSWTDDGLCIYHLLVWSNFNFLHISQWITLPNHSCVVL